MRAYTIAAVVCALNSANGHYTEFFDEANEERIYPRQRAAKVKFNLEKFRRRGFSNTGTEAQAEVEFFWERELTKSSKSSKGSKSGKSKGSKSSKSRHRMLRLDGLHHDQKPTMEEEQVQNDFFWDRALTKSYSSKTPKSSKSKGKNSKSHHRLLGSKMKYTTVDGQNHKYRELNGDEAEIHFWERALNYSTKNSKSKSTSKSDKSSKSGKSKGSKSTKSHY